MTTNPAPKTVAVFELEEAAVVFKTFLITLDFAEKTASITNTELPPELTQAQELCRQVVFETEKGKEADVPRIKELNRQLGGIVPGHFGVRMLF